MKSSICRKKLIDNKIKIASYFRFPINAVIQVNFVVLIVPLSKNGREEFCRKIITDPSADLACVKAVIIYVNTVKSIIAGKNKMFIGIKRKRRIKTFSCSVVVSAPDIISAAKNNS